MQTCHLRIVKLEPFANYKLKRQKCCCCCVLWLCLCLCFCFCLLTMLTNKLLLIITRRLHCAAFSRWQWQLCAIPSPLSLSLSLSVSTSGVAQTLIRRFICTAICFICCCCWFMPQRVYAVHMPLGTATVLSVCAYVCVCLTVCVRVIKARANIGNESEQTCRYNYN